MLLEDPVAVCCSLDHLDCSLKTIASRNVVLRNVLFCVSIFYCLFWSHKALLKLPVENALISCAYRENKTV